jgi:hypothetical protein
MGKLDRMSSKERNMEDLSSDNDNDIVNEAKITTNNKGWGQK